MPVADSRGTNAAKVVAVLVAILLLSAWLNRFVQDDAFISFRYARNLVEGHGLTFNPGEPVEGYTNFLWTLSIAAGMAMGFDAVTWSQALGLAFFAASLLATYRLAALGVGAHQAGLVATLLTGTNFTFNAYATGGLETQSQAFFVVAAVLLSTRLAGRPASIPLLLSTSAVYALAILTRLDSVVCLLVPGFVVVRAVLKGGGGVGRRLGRLATFAAPCILLLTPWIAWKVTYYGDVLPNTFYVKVTSAASLARGGHYVYRFFATYWLLPLAALAVLARPRELARTLRTHASGANRGPLAPGVALAITVGLWCAYVALVGGDFMEFRFMVPILPLLMVLLTWTLFGLVEDRRARATVVFVVMLGSLFHAATFWGVRDIESIRSLEIHMEPGGGDWDEVGRTLSQHFDPESGVRVAVGPAGAIPYYSRLETLDMRGLVDRWVARNGLIVSTVPGHQRMAPLDYLVAQKVNLVVGHPQVVSEQAGLPEAFTLVSLAQFGLADVSVTNVPPEARVLAIPMPGERRLLVIYLVRHPAVEQAIAENGWVTVPLDGSVRSF